MSIDTIVRLKVNMSKLKWPKKDLRSSNNNIMSKNFRNWFSTKPNKKKSVNKLIFNNTNSSISNGTKIYFKPSKKMPKLSDLLKTDIPKKSSKTDKFSTRSFLWPSSIVVNYLINRRCRPTWQSKRSKL